MGANNGIYIEGRKISMPDNYLDKVTYVPSHVKGNAGHEDCEQGVIVGISEEFVKVLFCKGRTVQVVRPQDLVFG